MDREAKIERLKKLKAEKIEVARNILNYREKNKIEFFDKPPNPGPNPKQAQILEAFPDISFKTFGMDGGNRLGKCLTYQTLIHTPDGEISIGELYERGKPFKVYAWNGKSKVICEASAPFRKEGLHKCYEIMMDDGRSIQAADLHRILTKNGWFYVEQLQAFYDNHLQSNLDTYQTVHVLSDNHLNQKQSDCLGDYSENLYQYGEQLLFYKDNDQVFSPLPNDAQQHTQPSFYLDGQVNKYTNNPCKENVLLSILGGLTQTVGQFFEFLYHSFCKPLLYAGCYNQPVQQPTCGSLAHIRSKYESGLLVNSTSCSQISPISYSGNRIESITPITTLQEVYDFEVEKYHNYCAGGLIHHNTTLLTIIGISVIRGKYLWDNTSLLHLFPHKKPRKVRYIGQGWHDHIKGVVIPELYKWWPENFAVERSGNGIITDTLWKDIQTGGTIEIMSNTQNPKVHEGWSGDLILYDEPPKREIYVANARGLVDRRGREMFAATLLDEPWVDREIVKKVDEDGKPDKSIFWVSGTSYDNVGYGITEEGINEFKTKLTEDEVQARIFGVPQYMQGLIYPQFKRKIHLFEHFKIPLNWMVDIGIDIHPREKQAVLFVATDPRNERYICDEIWDYGDGTQVAEAIVRKVNQNSYRVNRIIVDPLSKGDSNNRETTYQKIFNVLSRHDLPLEVASKDKDAGILEVKKHLKGPNNMPSMFLLDNCMRTLYEIEGYMWDKKTQKPMDKDDHMMENLYRICLLNTQYEEEDFWIPEHNVETRNAITGY